MTFAVVWLLQIPGLLAVGGAGLVWIAYKLVLDTEGDASHARFHVAPGFWGAMKTIVVADALMGLDNVLAVAGAAQGSFVLVAAGLLISIPIVVWGSQLILKFVERHPAIIYVGAGVLAWTAVKMFLSEPLLQPFLIGHSALVVLLYLAVIGAVLIGGFLVNHREVRLRIAAHIVDDAVDLTADTVTITRRGASAMKKVLLPVDGSRNSLKAVRHAVNRVLSDPEIELHLLHVRRPFSQHVARFVRSTDRESYHAEQAQKALAAARELLARFKLPHHDHVELGEYAATIVSVAERIGACEIVMGTARKNSVTRVLEDSVTYHVLETAKVPVEVVAGDAVSPFERFGVPAGLAAVTALLIVAID
jgi:YjbE family integral membrane protein